MTEEKDVAVANGEEKKEEEVDNGEDETDLESAIIRQTEYYFGDLNLPRDRFLREQIQLDEGWIPLEVLIKFNRLAKLSTDTDVIAKALAKSTSGLLEISDDNKKVRRHPENPIPEMNEERRKELMSRSIYAKGFPKDSSLDNILKFFKQHEEVVNVIMRKYQERNTKKRLFKGSVFVTFKTKEQAEKFLSAPVKYEEGDLLTLWQEDYINKKQEEYASRRDQKETKQKKKEKKENDEKPKITLPKGCVLHFTEGKEQMKREDIKDALTEIGAEVAYVDCNLGDTEGWVRLSKENSAKEFLEKHPDGKVKIGDKEVIFKIVDGEEEDAYLEKTVEGMTKRRNNMKVNRFNKNRGRNFKGKQGNKRKQNNHEDAPAQKVKAES